MSLETGEVFEKVKPIILKLKRHYYLQLWETDDWLQEGHLVLVKLLERHPELVGDEAACIGILKPSFRRI